MSCSLWFTAELNAKDHIEGIHKFKEGEGTSFYECLRRHGIEWFGSRRFFEQRKETNQAIWMDMALARRSGAARQNIAELLLYVDDHAAHLANCASADDDTLTLMSAELLPPLEGGIRAALEEVNNL